MDGAFRYLKRRRLLSAPDCRIFGLKRKPEEH
jgi:hypothetical protein